MTICTTEGMSNRQEMDENEGLRNHEIINLKGEFIEGKRST